MSAATPQAHPPTIRAITASETYALRHAVLWPHKPLEHVKLPSDASGRHFGAFIRLPPTTSTDDGSGSSREELVSIISLFVDDEERGDARFRKFATAPAWQGRGVGSALLAYTIEAAASAGARRVWCDARQSALGFYRRFGMEAEGDVFWKGEVPYLRMVRTLS
ncbi:GCN5-like N-acetyltransferase [Xylariaceae sp. FL0662B]|nr:GCN5-like N-acetyltransferase [Xylariaceae sp. FL0662B]